MSATYDQLPVYKVTYDLLLAIYQEGQHLKREYRYTIGEDLKTEVTQALMCIFRAMSAVDKTPHIAQAREHIETAKLQIRLLRDLRQITVPVHAKRIMATVEITKQLAAWLKSEKNKATRLASPAGSTPPDGGSE